jgi:hypothetical protein
MCRPCWSDLIRSYLFQLGLISNVAQKHLSTALSQGILRDCSAVWYVIPFSDNVTRKVADGDSKADYGAYSADPQLSSGSGGEGDTTLASDDESVEREREPSLRLELEFAELPLYFSFSFDILQAFFREELAAMVTYLGQSLSLHQSAKSRAVARGDSSVLDIAIGQLASNYGKNNFYLSFFCKF